MVIGADTLSRIVDYTDRATCILFGDGAGAMLVERGEDEALGMIDFLNDMDGSGAEALKMPAGGSRLPASHETVDKRQHFIFQDGGAVFKYAVRRMYEVCRDLLARNHLKAQDIAVFIPHQANRRIITATADRLGLRPEQVIINIARYGNTTNATIPLATQEAIESGKIRKGDLVLLATVGAGYTVGASLWRWAY
jgi:3-oxoacyl-[acyl-carrier-protein] synthase-3